MSTVCVALCFVFGPEASVRLMVGKTNLNKIFGSLVFCTIRLSFYKVSTMQDYI